MKKKILSLMLAIVLAMGVFSGVCFITASAATTENLLELYKFNPSFSDTFYNSTEPFYANGETLSLYSAASQDGDGKSALASNVKSRWGSYHQLVDIIIAQGEGATFAGSYWVKAANAGETVKFYNTMKFNWGDPYTAETQNKTGFASWGGYTSYYFDESGNKVSLKDTSPVTAGSDKWVKIYFEINNPIEFTKTLSTGKVVEFNSATVYITRDEADYNSGNKCDLLYDNWEFYRTDGKEPVVPEFSDEPAIRVDNSTLRRYKETAIGAIYYNNWYTTPSEDNEYGYNYWERNNVGTNANGASLESNNHNSGQDARCLSPAEFRYKAPFWSKIVEGTDVVIPSDMQDGKLIAFEFDEETWQKEMAYAYYAGINYMAYLGSTREAIGGDPARWHVKNEGKLKYTYDGTKFIENAPGTEPVMQMCIFLQESTQDIPFYISIMKEDYYYKIDNCPVMYFFEDNLRVEENSKGPANVVEKVYTQISAIRRKAALAGINNMYMIQTNANSTTHANAFASGSSTAIENANGVGYYSFGTAYGTADEEMAAKQQQIDGASFTDKINGNLTQWKAELAEYQRKRTFQGYHDDAMAMMESVASDSNVTNTASVVPMFSLGRDQRPRMHSPVSWSGATGIANKPYAGRYTIDPTTDEITNGLLEVLNFNKKNYSKFKANSVLMYAWNEFSEGGWICPTLNVDANGNIIDYDTPNTSHLEAVKRAIDIYRSTEKYTKLTTDVNGTLKDSNGNVVDINNLPSGTSPQTYMLGIKNAAVATSKTPYSITFTSSHEGMAFSLAKSDSTGANLGGAKPTQSSGTFTGLTPGAYYVAYAHATADSYEYFEGCWAAPVSAPAQTYSTIQTAPQIKNKTATTITVAKEDWEGYEYRLDNGNWVSTNVFTGLTPSTSYTVYARVPNTDTVLSTKVTTNAKTTPAAPDAPIIESYSKTSVTLKATAGYEYSIDGSTWVSTNVFNNLTPGTTYNFYQRTAATADENNSPASAKTTVTLPKNTIEMQAVPVAQVIGYDSVTLVAIDGAEYSKDGQIWQDSNVFTGLSEGTNYTFYQRYKETAVQAQSNVTQAQIQTKLGHQITITLDTTGDFDYAQVSTVLVNGSAVDLTFIDSKASFVIARDSLVTLSFATVGEEYKPVSIRYAGTKGAALGTDNLSFVAYGNRSDYVVKYVSIEDTTIVNMFYLNASGEKVVFDSFIAEGNVTQKIEDYPQLYNKTFKKYTIDETDYANANRVASYILSQSSAEIDVEVVYVNSQVSVTPGYKIETYENMQVTIDEAPVEGNVAPLSLVRFTAAKETNEGKFSYWADAEGNAVSYNLSYTRYITGNVDIKPVYGAEGQQAAITVKVADNEGKLVIIAERSLKSGLDILEHGVILAEYETDELTLNDVGENQDGKVYLGRRIDDNGSVLNNGTYILTKGNKHSQGGEYSALGTTLSFVAYVRYLDENGQEQVKYTAVKYSDVKAVEQNPSLDFDEID